MLYSNLLSNPSIAVYPEFNCISRVRREFYLDRQNLTSDFGVRYGMATFRSNVASRVQDAGVSLWLYDSAAGLVTQGCTLSSTFLPERGHTRYQASLTV